MDNNSAKVTSLITDEQYQHGILPGVSRTFALTIPQLPKELRAAVTNAYLLCRIADTIEDDSELSIAEKEAYLEQFNNVVASNTKAAELAFELSPKLSERTLADEKDLMNNMVRVVRFTHQLNSNQCQALQRCVAIMAPGMHKFEHRASLDGLADMPEMDSYCYYVAGVVGEMLTELFCDYSEDINQHRDTLMKLAPSFGQGLQMTNILKDIWEDQQVGVCWLPRAVFTEAGFDLAALADKKSNAAYIEGLQQLVGLALGHLENALEYTLLIPAAETGIRRFCLWAIGLAVLTLRNIYNNPQYQSGQEVKVSRRTVKTTIFTINTVCKNDTLLRWLFKLSAKGLPKMQPIATLPQLKI